MPRVGFELVMIVHALDRVVTVIGLSDVATAGSLPDSMH
jgi:hypothetical protein